MYVLPILNQSLSRLLIHYTHNIYNSHTYYSVSRTLYPTLLYYIISIVVGGHDPAGAVQLHAGGGLHLWQHRHLGCIQAQGCQGVAGFQRQEQVSTV